MTKAGTLQRSKSYAPSRGDREGAKVWIEGALDAIVSRGPEAIKIERLAREIGVSKGSFYWFFDGLDDLLRRALEHWRDDINGNLFDEIQNRDTSAREKLTQLIDAIFSSRIGRYDAPLRAWAMRSDLAAEIINQVDLARISFLRDMFADLGCANDEEFAAHMFYRSLVAESYISFRPAELTRQEFLKSVLSQLLSRAEVVQ